MPWLGIRTLEEVRAGFRRVEVVREGGDKVGAFEALRHSTTHSSGAPMVDSLKQLETVLRG